MDRKKEIISLILGFLGSMLGLIGVATFNQYILMSLPLIVRMIMMIITYWAIVIVPVIIMICDKKPLSEYGFCREHILRQILIGVVLGLAMSAVFTVTPHLIGFGENFDSGKRYSYLWQYIYEFAYCIIAVGFAEELVFRGFLYKKFKAVFGTEISAVIGSSVLFGLFHILGGNIGQIIMTGFLGVLFCLFRMKIKGCSTLSLIIMHGVYDALITVWSNVL